MELKPFYKIIKEEKIDQDGILQNIKIQAKKDLKRLNISKKDLDKAAKELATAYKAKNVVFYAVQDWDPIEKIDLMFNINDNKHKLHQSTIIYKWLPIESRGITKK